MFDRRTRERHGEEGPLAQVRHRSVRRIRVCDVDPGELGFRIQLDRVRDRVRARRIRSDTSHDWIHEEVEVQVENALHGERILGSDREIRALSAKRANDLW